MGSQMSKKHSSTQNKPRFSFNQGTLLSGFKREENSTNTTRSLQDWNATKGRKEKRATLVNTPNNYAYVDRNITVAPSYSYRTEHEGFVRKQVSSIEDPIKKQEWTQRERFFLISPAGTVIGELKEEQKSKEDVALVNLVRNPEKSAEKDASELKTVLPAAKGTQEKKKDSEEVTSAEANKETLNEDIKPEAETTNEAIPGTEKEEPENEKNGEQKKSDGEESQSKDVNSEEKPDSTDKPETNKEDATTKDEPESGLSEEGKAEPEEGKGEPEEGTPADKGVSSTNEEETPKPEA